MTGQIIDGRRKFGCSLADFYSRHDIAQAAANAGVLIPPVGPTDPSDEPALAFVNPYDNQARWICRCPACPGGSAYVWLDQPIMFCLYCGDRDIGGRWRAVTLPADPGGIEALLLARGDVRTMVWEPGESLTKLRAENDLLAGVV